MVDYSRRDTQPYIPSPWRLTKTPPDAGRFPPRDSGARRQGSISLQSIPIVSPGYRRPNATRAPLDPNVREEPLVDPRTRHRTGSASVGGDSGYGSENTHYSQQGAKVASGTPAPAPRKEQESQTLAPQQNDGDYLEPPLSAAAEYARRYSEHQKFLEARRHSEQAQPSLPPVGQPPRRAKTQVAPSSHRLVVRDRTPPERESMMETVVGHDYTQPYDNKAGPYRHADQETITPDRFYPPAHLDSPVSARPGYADDYLAQTQEIQPPSEASFGTYVSRFKRLVAKIKALPMSSPERVTADYYPGAGAKTHRHRRPMLVWQNPQVYADDHQGQSDSDDEAPRPSAESSSAADSALVGDAENMPRVGSHMNLNLGDELDLQPTPARSTIPMPTPQVLQASAIPPPQQQAPLEGLRRGTEPSFSEWNWPAPSALQRAPSSVPPHYTPLQRPPPGVPLTPREPVQFAPPPVAPIQMVRPVPPTAGPAPGDTSLSTGIPLGWERWTIKPGAVPQMPSIPRPPPEPPGGRPPGVSDDWIGYDNLASPMDLNAFMTPRSIHSRATSRSSPPDDSDARALRYPLADDYYHSTPFLAPQTSPMPYSSSDPQQQQQQQYISSQSFSYATTAGTQAPPPPRWQGPRGATPHHRAQSFSLSNTQSPSYDTPSTGSPRPRWDRGGYVPPAQLAQIQSQFGLPVHR